MYVYVSMGRERHGNGVLVQTIVRPLAALLLRAALRGSGIVARALLRAGLFASFSLAKGKKIVSHGMQQTTDDAAAKGQHKPMHKPHSHTLTLGDGYGFKCGGGERSVWS